MQEIIDTYKAEIRHAEEMMEKWKGHVLQHTVAEQIKITYERVVEDLESHLKFHGVLQNVSECDHSNYSQGHSPFVACVCNDCGQEI